MVSNFFSADYCCLRLRNGKWLAQVLFQAGKNRDGYFTHEEVLEQLTKAMDLIKEEYPDDIHAFVLDNAPSHLNVKAGSKLDLLRVLTHFGGGR